MSARFGNRLYSFVSAERSAHDLIRTPRRPALRQALELLADPPTKPDVSKGYLDLLGTGQVEDVALPKNTGSIQAVCASPVGSMLYDNAQALVAQASSPHGSGRSSG